MDSSSSGADENLIHPFRWLVGGKSKSGKTTEVVRTIKKKASQFHRIKVICPSFTSQKTFDPIRKLVKKEDIYEQVTEGTIKRVIQKIQAAYDNALRKGEHPERILLLVDDMAGNPAIQGRRVGSFANFSTRCIHVDCSMVVITQQPTCVDANFRDNAEFITMFPSNGEDDWKWLKRAYTSLCMNDKDMLKIARRAWTGDNADKPEWGKHFLFIFAQPRSHARFFIDYKTEIEFSFQ